MREAVGGSLLLYLIIPIIIIFIVFIGFIMNYASAYRAANYIVTQIETCQGHSDCKSNWSTEVVSSKYHYVGPATVSCRTIDGVTNAVVYDVNLKVVFDLPVIGSFNAYSVKSETKSMHNNTCKDGNYTVYIR